MQTGDIRLIKDINERVILNLIREHKLISGAQLANITGMQASTIAKLLRTLQAKSLILNRGKGESTFKGGKRPFLWSLNNDVGYVIGIEFIGVDAVIDQAIGVLLDIEGNIIHSNHFINPSLEEPTDLADLAVNVVNDLLAFKNNDLSNVLGLGIGIGGIVDAKQGNILTTPAVMQQTNIPLKKMLEARFNFPVFIDNNAKAAAQGEKWLGGGRGVEDFVMAVVYSDRGVGGIGIGLVLRNELFYGTNFAAGELNRTLPPLEFELRAKHSQLADGHIVKQYLNATEKINTRILMDAAKEGDVFALDYFNRLGYKIGQILLPVVGIINPVKIIIEGEVAELRELLTTPMKEAIDREANFISSSALQIEPGSHGTLSVSIGAASIILNDIFRMPSVISNSINQYFSSKSKNRQPQQVSQISQVDD